MEKTLYEMALSMVPGIGPRIGRQLIEHLGSAREVFRLNPKELKQFKGLKRVIAEIGDIKTLLDEAEREYQFIEKNSIQALSFQDADYPKRLLHCEDSPLVLYFKGNCKLNHSRVVGVVGSRRITNYGKDLCEHLIEGMKAYNVMVVSGLAYGVDTLAHHYSVKQSIPTIGVLGHGLDRIYPDSNRQLAIQMLEGGGLLSEFPSRSKPDRENFPKRNRIIAGMCDATIVVESAEKGGALITAEIASSYNRDVFAFPGRVSDPMSGGCNRLIQRNIAALINNVEDVAYMLSWEKRLPAERQMNLFNDLNKEEKAILKIISEHEKLGIEALMLESNTPASKLSPILMSLEFKGAIKCLPGNNYQINQKI